MDKKQIKFLFFTVPAVLILIPLGWYILANFEQNPTDKSSTDMQAPKHLSEIGPYLEGMALTREFSNKHIIRIKARTLHLTKNKILGFKSSLSKNVVAKNMRVVIMEKGNRNVCFRAYKDKFVQKGSDIELDSIELDNPVVSLPKLKERPDKIRIDKKNSRIVLYFENHQKMLSFGNPLSNATASLPQS